MLLEPKPESTKPRPKTGGVVAYALGGSDNDRTPPRSWPAVEHRRWGQCIRFCQHGIDIPRFWGRRCFLPWDAIDFVSLTPSYSRKGEEWVPTYANTDGLANTDRLGLSLHDDSLDYLLRRGLLSLCVVVKNRHACSLRLKPLMGADDKPESCRGFIELDLRRYGFDCPLDLWLNLLDAHARFDLLCFF